MVGMLRYGNGRIRWLGSWCLPSRGKPVLGFSASLVSFATTSYLYGDSFPRHWNARGGVVAIDIVYASARTYLTQATHLLSSRAYFVENLRLLGGAYPIHRANVYAGHLLLPRAGFNCRTRPGSLFRGTGRSTGNSGSTGAFRSPAVGALAGSLW